MYAYTNRDHHHNMTPAYQEWKKSCGTYDDAYCRGRDDWYDEEKRTPSVLGGHYHLSLYDRYKTVDKDQLEKLLQSYIKDPVASHNDRKNSVLYSYAIGYMYAYESKDHHETEYKNPMGSAYKEWEKNCGHNTILQLANRDGGNDCQNAASFGENYNQDLYDRYKTVDREQAEKLFQSFIKAPVTNNNDRKNSVLYSYAIGYMHAYLRDEPKTGYENPMNPAYDEWEKNYGDDKILRPVNSGGGDDCRRAASFGENYDRNLYDR
jgi:hypothetical protein